MRKLIVFAGLSGSGKSTAARTLLEETPGASCFHYDTLRLAEGGWPPENLTQLLIKLVSHELKAGTPVIIVDSSNLHSHDHVRWETLAWAYAYELDWRWMDTPVEVCIKRDALRSDPVGEAVIRTQAALVSTAPQCGGLTPENGNGMVVP